MSAQLLEQGGAVHGAPGGGRPALPRYTHATSDFPGLGLWLVVARGQYGPGTHGGIWEHGITPDNALGPQRSFSRPMHGVVW